MSDLFLKCIKHSSFMDDKLVHVKFKSNNDAFELHMNNKSLINTIIIKESLH